MPGPQPRQRGDGVSPGPSRMPAARGLPAACTPPATWLQLAEGINHPPCKSMSWWTSSSCWRGTAGKGLGQLMEQGHLSQRFGQPWLCLGYGRAGNGMQGSSGDTGKAKGLTVHPTGSAETHALGLWLRAETLLGSGPMGAGTSSTRSQLDSGEVCGWWRLLGLSSGKCKTPPLLLPEGAGSWCPCPGESTPAPAVTSLHQVGQGAAA